ncbi:cell division control protein Cdc6, partial [Halorubrum sp. SP3]
MGTDDSDDPAENPGPSEDEVTAQAELSSASQPESSRQASSSHVTNGDSQPDEGADSEGPSQSIEDMLLEFDDQEGLIRDRELLDPNYVVEEDRIVGRDEQLQEVTKMLRVALGDNRPPNLFLYGPSGTGKSLITKAVCHN